MHPSRTFSSSRPVVGRWVRGQLCRDVPGDKIDHPSTVREISAPTFRQAPHCSSVPDPPTAPPTRDNQCTTTAHTTSAHAVISRYPVRVPYRRAYLPPALYPAPSNQPTTDPAPYASANPARSPSARLKRASPTSTAISHHTGPPRPRVPATSAQTEAAVPRPACVPISYGARACVDLPRGHR